MATRLLNYFLFGIIALIGCQSEEPLLMTYGVWGDDIIRPTTCVINLDDFETYKSLLSQIEQLYFNGTVPVLTMDTAGFKFNIWLAPLNSSTGCVLIKKRNVFDIVDDKIRSTYPLDSLEILFEKHYLNYNKSDIYSVNPESSIVRIVYSKIEMDRLKEILFRLLMKFEKIKVDNRFILKIDRPFPPPPPILDETF